MRRRTAEERYKFNIRKQVKTLEEFAENAEMSAGHLKTWYGLKKLDMPDDEYRACAFFENKEYLGKPGSLSLCYEMYLRCMDGLPEFTRERAFDLLRFRYKCYAKVLFTGGYDDVDWG